MSDSPIEAAVERVLAEDLVTLPGSTVGGQRQRERARRLAAEVTKALGAETRVEWGVRAENGREGYAPEKLARAIAAGDKGYTIGGDHSPIVAGLTRSISTIPALVGEWQEVEA